VLEVLIGGLGLIVVVLLGLSAFRASRGAQ
jgi:hypothetical protein